MQELEELLTINLSENQISEIDNFNNNEFSVLEKLDLSTNKLENLCVFVMP